MRGAIIGFGTIALGHLTAYATIDDLSITAVLDVCEARRQCAQQHFGLSAYADFPDLTAHHDLDFIDICAPPDTHSAYTLLGLGNGLHVLCEKPIFTPGADGYQRILADIQASDKIFYPCHVYKFAPILTAIRDLVFDPGFGEVLEAHFRTLRRGHAVGVPEWRPHWRRDPRISGGGILRDHGPHSVYLAMNLTGHTPLAVSCLTGGLRRDRYQDTEDTALLEIRCDQDVDITLTLSWAAGHRDTGYSIIGSSGCVIVDNNNLTATVSGEVARSVIESGFDDPSHRAWFRDMLLDFLDMVAHPDRQPDLLREAVITSMVIDGAYESAAEDGQWVDIRLSSSLPT